MPSRRSVDIHGRNGLSRREFIQACAAAGTVLPGALGASQDPPEPPARPVLAPSDFSYLGFFKVHNSAPFPNSEFSFSSALMTGRYEGGAPRLLLSGPDFRAGVTDAAGLVELAIPPESALTSDLATAPHAVKVRRWDQKIFANQLIPNSGPPDNNGIRITGIHYVGNDFGNASQLFWTYGSAYGDPGYFPNISTSVLRNDGTATSRGPWGSNKGWEASCGWMVNVPRTVQTEGQCGPLAFGAQVHGNAGSSPWGVNLHAFTPPALNSPADTLKTRAINAKTAIYHGMDHPQARNRHYRACGPNASNQAFDAALRACPSGQHLSASDDGEPAMPADARGPFGVFGLPQSLYPGMGITLDWIDSMCWIHGPNKQGVVAFGQLAETISIANGFKYNKVYTGSDPTHAHVGYGSMPCCHGQTDPTFEATGPFAGSLVHYGWIYDPADLVKILKGELASHDASPTATFHMHSIAPGIPEERLKKYAFGGSWFDAATGRLYLSEHSRYMDGADLLPIVHVFSVNC